MEILDQLSRFEASNGSQEAGVKRQELPPFPCREEERVWRECSRFGHPGEPFRCCRGAERKHRKVMPRPSSWPVVLPSPTGQGLTQRLSFYTLHGR